VLREKASGTGGATAAPGPTYASVSAAARRRAADARRTNSARVSAEKDVSRRVSPDPATAATTRVRVSGPPRGFPAEAAAASHALSAADSMTAAVARNMGPASTVRASERAACATGASLTSVRVKDGESPGGGAPPYGPVGSVADVSSATSEDAPPPRPILEMISSQMPSIGAPDEPSRFFFRAGTVERARGRAPRRPDPAAGSVFELAAC
jgi:hypothetical protein